jgi:hypothetical protein
MMHRNTHTHTHSTVVHVQAMDRILETPDNIGIKLFVSSALKGHKLYLSLLLFCMFTLCVTSVSALQAVFSNSSRESTAIWETCEICKEDRLLVRV